MFRDQIVYKKSYEKSEKVLFVFGYLFMRFYISMLWQKANASIWRQNLSSIK